MIQDILEALLTYYSPLIKDVDTEMCHGVPDHRSNSLVLSFASSLSGRVWNFTMYLQLNNVFEANTHRVAPIKFFNNLSFAKIQCK